MSLWTNKERGVWFKHKLLLGAVIRQASEHVMKKQQGSMFSWGRLKGLWLEYKVRGRKPLVRLHLISNHPLGHAAQSRQHGSGRCLPRKHAGLCTDMQLCVWVQWTPISSRTVSEVSLLAVLPLAELHLWNEQQIKKGFCFFVGFFHATGSPKNKQHFVYSLYCDHCCN